MGTTIRFIISICFSVFITFNLFANESPFTGDLIFTEIMANPGIGPEWLELYNTTQYTLNMQGCILADGGIKGHEHAITEDLWVPPFSFFVFSAGEFPSLCEYEPDCIYAKSKLVFSNSGIEEVILYCPTGKDEVLDNDKNFNVIDRFVWDLSKMGSEKGQSLSLCQGYFTFKENDSLSGWRASISPFCSVFSEQEKGTPSFFVPCDGVQNTSEKPAAGSIRLTEIMVTPTKGSVEWFELFNREDKAIDLGGCHISVISNNSLKQQKINITGTAIIEAHSYFVMSRSRCIDFLCELSDYVYKGLILNDTEEGEIAIICEQEEKSAGLVDSMTFNYGGKNTMKGYSFALNHNFLFEEGKYDPKAWCEASRDTKYLDQNGNENFGTPGEENVCGKGETDDSKESLDERKKMMSCNFSDLTGFFTPVLIITFLFIAFLIGCRGRSNNDGKNFLPISGKEVENMSFEQVMEKRRSIRKFLNKAVEKEKLDKIFERLITAPSAGNLQAYKVYVIREPDRLQALARAAWGQNFIAEAPVCLVFFADPKISMRKYGNRGKELYSIQDATIAALYAWLETVNQGLSCVWVGAFDDNEVSTVTEADPELRPVAILPLGYAGENPYPTSRKQMEEIIKIKN